MLNDGQHRSKKRAKCPYCGFQFRRLAVHGDKLPDLAPTVCEGCARISLWEDGQFRQVNDEELKAIQSSPAWEFLSKVRQVILEHNGGKTK